MGREFEVKLRAESRETLSRIAQDPAVRLAARGPARELAMESTYYDTPARELSALRWTLRLRRENDRQVATVKTPIAGRGRGEWETEAENILEAVPRLIEQGAPRELEALAASGLEVRCGASFRRQAVDLTLPDGTWAELALDEGRLIGGSRQEPFSEVELELKMGSEEAVEQFAGALALGYGLAAQTKSKFARASALAE